MYNSLCIVMGNSRSNSYQRRVLTYSLPKVDCYGWPMRPSKVTPVNLTSLRASLINIHSLNARDYAFENTPLCTALELEEGAMKLT